MRFFVTHSVWTSVVVSLYAIFGSGEGSVLYIVVINALFVHKFCTKVLSS